MKKDVIILANITGLFLICYLIYYFTFLKDPVHVISVFRGGNRDVSRFPETSLLEKTEDTKFLENH